MGATSTGSRLVPPGRLATADRRNAGHGVVRGRAGGPRTAILQRLTGALATALLVAGCGGGATPTLSLEGWLARACDGQQVPDAAAYEARQPGPHPVRIVTIDGGQHPWSGSVPASWRAADAEDVELVVCVEEPVEVPRSPCEAPAVERWAEVVDVRVVAAATGRQIDELSLTGLPDDCEAIAAGSGQATGRVAVADLLAGLEPIVLAVVATATPRPSPTPAPSPRRVELAAAINEGAITVTIRGDGLQAIDLTITPQVEVELEVEVMAGTRFAPAAAGVQVMIVTESAVLRVHPKVELQAELEVACGEMRDGTPTANDQFGLVAGAPPADLVKLLALPDFPRQTFRVRQFAIWTITDNPARADFVGLQSTTSSGGPATSEITRIKELFTAAAIPLTRYKLTK